MLCFNLFLKSFGPKLVDSVNAKNGIPFCSPNTTELISLEITHFGQNILRNQKYSDLCEKRFEKSWLLDDHKFWNWKKTHDVKIEKIPDKKENFQIDRG